MINNLGSHEIAGYQEALVEKLVLMGCIKSPNIEEAFRIIPRHLFTPGVALEKVYSDISIPTKILDGKLVSSSSQPAIMAIMLEQLQLQPGHRVLEIGAGTGFNAGLMAYLVGDSGQVVTVDIDEDIVESAQEHLTSAGLDKVKVVCGDGGMGYAKDAPYDRIILTVGSWDIVPAWWEQLKPGGRLLMPLEIKGGIKTRLLLTRKTTTLKASQSMVAVSWHSEELLPSPIILFPSGRNQVYLSQPMILRSTKIRFIACCQAHIKTSLQVYR
jgi:protein-L-isoaspartate(D-aspartate) O-methyltransferase